ncbi:MAG: hypothetical protein U0Q22_01330 [Acidimicrobiales bacterium]
MKTSTRVIAGLAAIGAASATTVCIPAAGATAATPEQVITDAATARGITLDPLAVQALAAQLGTTEAATAFVNTTPEQADAGMQTVVVRGPVLVNVAANASSTCTSRSDRYSARDVTNSVELMYHVMKSTWCWDNNGNVTSVSAIRTGYGATFAGQVQGYRWTADPTVQEQRVYLSNSYTDKYGTHNFYKGRSRLTGHWAICLAGPLNWACPVEHDAHTVDELGYGSTASSSSYNW